jgi:hypothetical protein
MTGMDHFGIADSEDNEKFQRLAVMAENLDKEDFFDSSYYVDEGVHPAKGSREASSSGRVASASKKGKGREPTPAEVESTMSKERLISVMSRKVTMTRQNGWIRLRSYFQIMQGTTFLCPTCPKPLHLELQLHRLVSSQVRLQVPRRECLERGAGWNLQRKR